MFLTLLLSSLLTFVELNVENLFDTQHDSLKNDLQYTPDGDYKWTPTRYWHKINSLSQEIIALGDPKLKAEEPVEKAKRRWHMPDFVALCEVENDSTMVDLTKRSLLRNVGYEYVMTCSPDERGIDVALLYRPSSYQLLNKRTIRIQNMPYPTRDILYTSGVLIKGDTLHIFVVHAPSRRGGEKASRPYRLQVASQLAAAVDSVYAINPDAHVLVTGDFNDYHDSPALDSLYQHRLTNISAQAVGKNGAMATYRYRGEWNSLDQMLCSPALVKRLKGCQVGDLKFLLEEDPKYGGVMPFRTYAGPRYKKGYSDHLPLVSWFKF